MSTTSDLVYFLRSNGGGSGVPLRWLDSVPGVRTGTNWGVPWERGDRFGVEDLVLIDSADRVVPCDSRVLAYWPDGSVKWSGHSAALSAGLDEDLGQGVANVVDGRVTAGPSVGVSEEDDCLVVSTQLLTARFPRRGDRIIDSIDAGGRTCCSGMRLVGEVENIRRGHRSTVRTRRVMGSAVRGAVIEGVGDHYCVVRLEGVHEVQKAVGMRSWLPFVVRVYLNGASERIRLVHSFVFDGDPDVDFIAGLGIEVDVPLEGAAYNRHVRFGGADGLFAEPIQLLWTRLYRDGEGRYPAQIRGDYIDLTDPSQARLRNLLSGQATWRGYRLVQECPDYFAIEKRTKEGCCWVRAHQGTRSTGVVAVVAEGGGFAAGLTDFWQKTPRSLGADNLVDDIAKMQLWFWSPEGPVMDLRHYDTEPHMWTAYEGFDEMRSEATGIANTNEVWFQPLSRPSETATLLDLAQVAQLPPVLICMPERYHATGAFGSWSLPNRETEERAALEDQLDAVEQFYRDEVEQRRWYGFWDYGDVMHTYDSERHQWRYDLGGFAWQNTELVPNLWLWYSFLRSGRSETFRFAAAMTRHTSEVDIFHAGPYRGLGSRHNVRHWGCSCKEARISSALLHRPFYYLTGDERVGEIMDEVARDVEDGLIALDPAQTLVEADGAPTHVRSGPDWAALCGNWLTLWERRRDLTALAAITSGVDSIAEAPHRLLSGPVFGYDPRTRKLIHLGDDNYSYHMVVVFGASELWIELAGLLGDKTLGDMFAEFGFAASMTEEGRSEYTGGAIGPGNFRRSMFYSRAIAYTASRKQDERLAEQAWELLLEGESAPFLDVRSEVANGPLTPSTFREIPGLSTNLASQWSLSVIECLELVPHGLAEAWRKVARHGGGTIGSRG